MKRYFTILFFSIAFFSLSAQEPWVLDKGKGKVTLGYSQKTAGARWYPTSINTNDTPTGTDDTWSGNELQDAPNLIDGKFHDFRYTYFQPQFGLGKGFEVSALFLYLDGRERIDKDPATGRAITPEWETNRGLSDFWLRLKYKLPTKLPMALELSSRFPDFYDQPGKNYSRYILQKIGTDTNVVASSEWRGNMKRDLALLYHVGGSFDKKGRTFWKALAGYNLRQGAYADQIMLSAGTGYTFAVNKRISLVPNLLVDYTGGIGNGKAPDLTDRFYSSGRKNFYFNNSKLLRAYYSVYAKLGDRLGISAGYGHYLWGNGAVKYAEPFIQATWAW